ncbi:hypothetical protein EGW08_009444 [Elysia chlorotica]|uniref:Uncharacterized protein n=1 Tax=Elysia chlorotica TaxID=188477 RepID=A0A3S1C4J2_ELYCH|nr:hypothetical protein EGW08_009444 [Elysia chlorotica]
MNFAQQNLILSGSVESNPGPTSGTAIADTRTITKEDIKEVSNKLDRLRTATETIMKNTSDLVCNIETLKKKGSRDLKDAVAEKDKEIASIKSFIETRQLDIDANNGAINSCPVPNFMQLNSLSSDHQKMTAWVSAGETALLRRPKLALLPRPPTGGNVRLMRMESLKIESNSLARFQEVKKQQLELENYLMKKLNKRRGSLLLRRGQRMPRIEPDGFEKPTMEWERCDTPPPQKPPILSIFAYGDRGNEIHGLMATMSRRDRGHNVITEWLGTPEVTDVIMKELGVAPTDETSVKLREAEQYGFELNLNESETKDKVFVPIFPALAVVGQSYRDIMLSERFNTRGVNSSKTPTADTRRNQYRSIAKIRSRRESGEQISYQPKKPERDEGVVLYFGDHRLSWRSGGSTRAKQNCIVEIGGTADYGHSTVSSTTMRNAGTVAVRYSWVRCDRKDPFDTGRYLKLRFAFDSLGAVILPGETHRLPCLFKANDHGYFSEDWRLVSQPVLEGGEPVILRLWGITRKRSASRRGRDQIERDLRALITKSLATNTVNKIVDWLPLKEVPLKDTRFPLVHLGPDLFHIKNPNFHYKSAPVYRLKTLLEMFDSMNMRYGSQNDLSSCLSLDSNTVHSSKTSDLDTREGRESVEQHGLAHVGEENHFRASGYLFGESASRIAQSDLDIGSESYMDNAYDFEISSSESSETSEFGNQGYNPERIQFLIRKYQTMGDLDHAVVRVQKQPRSASAAKLTTKSASFLSDPNADKAGLVEKKGSKLDSGSQRRVNIVDPNFSVKFLRRQIYDTSNLNVQEAAFHVLSEEVGNLSFRPQLPIENWKQAMGHTYLCYVMDSFAQYAEDLRVTCCASQLQEKLTRRREREDLLKKAENELEKEESKTSVLETEKNESNVAGNDDTNENDAETSKPDTEENLISGSGPTSEFISEEGSNQIEQPYLGLKSVSRSISNLDTFMDTCCKRNPREMFTCDRYQDQYYSRLHTRMYELLCDFIDTVDSVWWTTRPEIKMGQDDLVFTKITNISRGANIEDYLNIPMPPTWIKMAQRMDTVATANRWRLKTTGTA